MEIRYELASSGKGVYEPEDEMMTDRDEGCNGMRFVLMLLRRCTLIYIKGTIWSWSMND